MLTKKQILSKLVLVPYSLWILNILIFFIPFFLVTHTGGSLDHIWFIYTIPAIIFSYYWGLWGGIITAFITISAQISWQFSDHFAPRGKIHSENYLVIILTSIISIAISFGVGLLANRLQIKNKQLDELTQKDILTGLWNRRGLLKLTDQWIQSKKQEQQVFSLLFIDLDKFKPVNDTHGHSIGDKLLQSVAMRIKTCVPEESIISRIGGDEFIILLKNADEADSIKIAEKITKNISEMFFIDGKEIFISASIGITLSLTPNYNIESLIQSSDIAMYFVKRRGRNGFLIFDQSMKEYEENRMYLEHRLHKALEHGELALYYQPQFDVETEKIVSFEALIRWNSNGKMISPCEFIPIAEETGLIIPIGRWVLETACRQIKSWIDAGYLPIPVSVNVSSYQFQHPDFIKNILMALQETEIEPNLLTLELTESVILGNEKTIVKKLNNIKQLGVSISIDDFGSGYSSLAYLKSFPINEIKMDKLFIDEIEHNFKDRLVVQTIIQLGQSLDTKVIAEGVETKEQFTFLKQVGCTTIQGYLFGKPMPAKDIEEMFQKDLAKLKIQ